MGLFNTKYLGLRGTKLNVAIGIIAGTDFLLFGYDQGVMGGLLTLPNFVSVFPEIDLTAAGTAGLSQSQRDHRSTIQGISVASYNVGCFFGAIICVSSPCCVRESLLTQPDLCW